MDEPSTQPAPLAVGPEPTRAVGWLALFALAYLAASFLYFIGYGVYLGVNNPGIEPGQAEQLVNAHAQSLDGLAGMYLVQFVIVVPVVLAASNFPGRSLREVLALVSVPGRQLGFWLGVWVVYQVAAVVMHSLVEVPQDAFVKQMSGSRHLAVTLVVVLLAPIMEELVFRGYLFRAWRHSKLGLSGTITFTSGLFLLLHMGQYNSLVLGQLFIFAVILGLAREKTGSVVTPWLLHAINNLFATVLITYMGVTP